MSHVDSCRSDTAELTIPLHLYRFLIIVTCVIEQARDEGAVPEEGVCGGDVLEVALFKHGVFEHHGLHLQVEEPGEQETVEVPKTVSF